MSATFDIAVIGAGAAGLTAAIFARREAPRARIVALDGAPRIGAKILISGGGRCNVTNETVTAADFIGNRNAIAKVLRTFPVGETIRWFESMGVSLVVEESKKLFPATNRARSVVDALLGACEDIEIRTGRRVTAVRRESDFFVIEAGEELCARRIVLAAGGRSVPKTGSDGSGYTLARGMGHTVTEVFPALVPLVLEEGHWLTALSGTAAIVELTVRSGSGRVLQRVRGSMLCTHFGLSGPAVLDVSRYWIEARRGDPRAGLTISFLPGETFESVEAAFLEEGSRNPHATPVALLRSRMPERIAAALARDAGAIARLSRDVRRSICRAAVETVAPVVRDRGFDYAEVTAGGVPLREIDLSTMESRCTPGLFLCGEILDVDGRIGGFNFQWAWASGRLAGMGVARATV